MPASASPVATAASVAFTSAPNVALSGGMVTPSWVRACAAYLPHGTVDAHNDTTPSSGRSASDFTFFGLPGLTTIVRKFDAKSTGSVVTWPPDTSFCMLVPSADAKTSAGAPPWICCTSVDDAAKLNVTVVPL